MQNALAHAVRAVTFRVPCCTGLLISARSVNGKHVVQAHSPHNTLRQLIHPALGLRPDALHTVLCISQCCV